jgi:hypothetical protein
MGDIRIDLREIGWKIVDLTRLTRETDQWRGPVNMVMNLYVP